MCLYERYRPRVHVRVLQGPPDSKLLPLGIRRGDPLALPVRRAADTPYDCIDGVVGLHRILQSLEDQYPAPFSHEESVGTIGEGSRTVRCEGSYLAELDESVACHEGIESP